MLDTSLPLFRVAQRLIVRNICWCPEILRAWGPSRGKIPRKPAGPVECRFDIVRSNSKAAGPPPYPIVVRLPIGIARIHSVVDSISASNHPAILRRPGKPYARSEQVILGCRNRGIAIDHSPERARRQRCTRGCIWSIRINHIRVKIEDLAFRLTPSRRYFVAQAEIKSQVFGDLVIVLDKKLRVPLACSRNWDNRPKPLLHVPKEKVGVR